MIKVSRRVEVILLAGTFVVGFCVVGFGFAGDNPSFVWDGPHLPDAVEMTLIFVSLIGVVSLYVFVVGGLALGLAALVSGYIPRRAPAILFGAAALAGAVIGGSTIATAASLALHSKESGLLEFLLLFAVAEAFVVLFYLATRQQVARSISAPESTAA